MVWNIILRLAIVAALTAPIGCGYDSRHLDPTLDKFFVEDSGEPYKANDLHNAQAAAGARADAMLNKTHFDGARLNSLGEEKLSLMLSDDDAPNPIMVYLNIDERDAHANARRTAVSEFLKDLGLADDQIQIAFGDNPAARSPAAQHLSRQNRAESGTGSPTGGDAKTPDGAAANENEPGAGFNSIGEGIGGAGAGARTK